MTETSSDPGENQLLPANEEKSRNGKKEPPRPPRKWIFVYVLVVLAALVGWGVYGRWQRNAEAAEAKQQTDNFVPTVRVATAKRVDDRVQMSLPGQTEPFELSGRLRPGDRIRR